MSIFTNKVVLFTVIATIGVLFYGCQARKDRAHLNFDSDMALACLAVDKQNWLDSSNLLDIMNGKGNFESEILSSDGSVYTSKGYFHLFTDEIRFCKKEIVYTWDREQKHAVIPYSPKLIPAQECGSSSEN